MRKIIRPSQFHYYTNDHEWIDFQGSIAYVGICDFKLKGLKGIYKIQYGDVSAVIKRGDILATILSDDYKIPMFMPVDGRIIEVNNSIIYQPDKTLHQSQHNGWIAKICPLAPYDREGLLSASQYPLIKKNLPKI